MDIKRKIKNIKIRILKFKNKRPCWISTSNDLLQHVNLYIPVNFNAMFEKMSKGTYDLFIYKELEKFIAKSNNVIWDIGSHIGYHALGFAAFVGEKGNVFAFEPNPYNRGRIKLHLEKNAVLAERIQLFDCALSDCNGEITFRLTGDVDSGESSGGYINSILPPLNRLSYNKFKNITVISCTGDSLIENKSVLPPDIVKIDVEGAELLVLKGLKRLIGVKKPIFFIEVHNILMMHYVSEFLRAFDYEIRILDEENANVSRCFICAQKKI